MTMNTASRLFHPARLKVSKLPLRGDLQSKCMECNGGKDDDDDVEPVPGDHSTTSRLVCCDHVIIYLLRVKPALLGGRVLWST